MAIRNTRRIWRLHSVVGLLSGIFLLVIGLSGSLLVFSAELDALFHPQLVRIAPAPPRLPFDRLLPRVAAQLPGWEITRWQVRPEATAADIVRVCPTGGNADLRAYVNPYSGEVLGRRAWRETVAGWLLELHYSFLLGTGGTVFVGVLAVLLLVAGGTGFWLRRRAWRHLWHWRWRASARLLFSDFHKAIGTFSIAFNFILGFTGAWWNLQSVPALWSADLPAHRAPGPLHSPSISLDALVAAAPQLLPGLDLAELTIEFPFRSGEFFSIVGRGPGTNPLRSHWGSSVSFHAQTGAVEKITDLRQQSLWARVEDTFTPLHYGTFGGLPIKLLWCLGGLTPGLLALSGFLIWRGRQWVRQSIN